MRPLAVVDPIVVALPRGGVAVGAELARVLRIPLDVLLVRKIGVPGNPEYGVGALTEDGHVSYDDAALARLGLSRSALATTVMAEREELQRRRESYRGDRQPPRLSGRDVIVVDDGLATGATARAALAMARRQRPARLSLAVPVGNLAAVDDLRDQVDRLVVLTAPANFRAVGEWYQDFTQLSDSFVRSVLAELTPSDQAGSGGRPVRIRVGETDIEADYAAPAHRVGTVVVAVDRDRTSAQYRALAGALRRDGLATLALDLGPEATDDASEPSAEQRLGAAVRWSRQATNDDPVGLCGVGTGADAVLRAAGELPDDVGAVVTCGGRLDIAESVLGRVHAPTLALVESEDSFVRELAEWAAAHTGARHEVREIAGVDRLLTDPGAWEEVGTAAAEWFRRALG
ncbi:phosphoribosyltransferase [Spiractinospora alimapuensis]|nr:phosphoribosyltransferase [Spiractinospora alimapuensis]